jgi:hypothetical protein
MKAKNKINLEHTMQYTNIQIYWFVKKIMLIDFDYNSLFKF